MSEKLRFKQSRKQLGSQADVIILCESDIEATQVFHRLWETMDEYEARFSRFNSESELTKLNKNAGQAMIVSDEFLNMIEACIRFNKITTGVFNPLILPALQYAGYKGSWPAVNTYDKSLDYSERRLVSFNEVIVKDKSVCLPSDTALDLGGIGKGYALDIASQLLEAMHVTDYCISFGGDIICNGNDTHKKPWKIGVSYVHDHDKPIAYFTNPDASKYAIASSTVVRRKGAGWNHLIDSETGKPTTSPVLMATAVTKTGVAADIAAKFFLLNPDGALKSASSDEEALCVFYQYDTSSKLVQKSTFIIES
ncbi:MAG TPA: FAD:protein FMN transferase [Candidatus Saccharibacteria bacterium]|jgi:thiamine biosynthesis lipoprotein|nr:FAD:protein FMN transferase [Candidatus Saccharibacteria bacterium]HMT55669.1 FAD:protein FMN transferase [Candidatus Saccharibacteria bacterium]